jgi:O-methyltransferase
MTMRLLSRLPGVRRYQEEIARLGERLELAKQENRRLKESEADYARQARAAHRYDYYWYNAEKKLDLRHLEPFGTIAKRVRKQQRTLLHLDRLYTLWQGVVALPAEATAVAEVGAFQGGSARFVAEAMRELHRELPFYVCDTFEGHAVVDPSVDGVHAIGKHFMGTSAERVAAYLAKFANVRVIAGDIRQTSAQLGRDDSFGLVHIDVDVYPITKFCLDFFAPRIAAGGTIVVDDYGFTTCAGAKKAVDEFITAHPRFRLFHLTTAQALVIPIAPT